MISDQADEVKGHRETESPFYSSFCTLKDLLVSNTNTATHDPSVPRVCIVRGSTVTAPVTKDWFLWASYNSITTVGAEGASGQTQCLW